MQIAEGGESAMTFATTVGAGQGTRTVAGMIETTRGVEATMMDAAAVRNFRANASAMRNQAAEAILRIADGIIVGRALQKAGMAGAGVDANRVRAFMTSLGRT